MSIIYTSITFIMNNDFFNMTENATLVETTRVSNSSSLRMSLPRRIADRIEAGEGDIIGFYQSESGDILIRKLS